MIITLFLALIIEYIVGYSLLKDKDIISPSLMVCLSMLIATFFAVLGTSLFWKTDISILTFFTIIITIAFLIFGDSLISHYSEKQKIKKISNYEKPIIIENWKILFVIAFGFFALFLQFREIIGSFASGNFGEKILRYRLSYADGSVSTRSFLYKHMLIFSMYIGYIFEYIFIYNRLVRKKFSDFFLLVPVCISAMHCLIEGARGNVIDLIIAFLFYSFFLYRDSRNWNKKKYKKIIKKLIIIVCITVLLFPIVGLFIGRIGQTNPILQICMYLGANVFTLDSFINNHIQTQEFFAQETFANIYLFFSNRLHFNLPTETIRIHNYLNDYPLGNVYGAILPWYHDFHLIGIPIISFFYGVIYSLWYRKIIKIPECHKLVFWIIIYGQFFNSLCLFMFNDRFFARIGPSLIKYLLVFYINYRFLFEYKVSYKMFHFNAFQKKGI